MGWIATCGNLVDDFGKGSSSSGATKLMANYNSFLVGKGYYVVCVDVCGDVWVEDEGGCIKNHVLCPHNVLTTQDVCYGGFG